MKPGGSGMEGFLKGRFARHAGTARRMGAAVRMMEGGYRISSELQEGGGSVQADGAMVST